jgi:hypothetical protein
MKGLAITSMILGILAILIPAFTCGLGAPVASFFALIGLIFASVSISKYNSSGSGEGKGMAKAGLILSIIVLAGNVALIFACGGLGALGASA